MVQLYSPPAARGLASRLNGSLFEERATERIWNVRVQHNAAASLAGTKVAQLLSKCPQTLLELVCKEEAFVCAGTQKFTTHTFELPSEVSVSELDDMLLWFKEFSDVSDPLDVNSDTRAALIFPPSLTKQDRALLHTHAQGIGLFSQSTGVAVARHITITATEQSTGPSSGVTAGISSLTCSDTLEPSPRPDMLIHGLGKGASLVSLTSKHPSNSALTLEDKAAPAESLPSIGHAATVSALGASVITHTEAVADPVVLKGQPAASAGGGQGACSEEPAATSSPAAKSKLAEAGEQSVPATSASVPSSVGSKARDPAQGRQQKQSAGGAGAAGRGQGSGRGTGGGMAGRARNGVQLSFAEQLYAWCQEAGGGYLEYSRGELQEMVATGGALPTPLQQLSDLRACGEHLFKKISLRDEAGAIAILEASPPAIVWLKDDSGCAPVHRAAYLGLLAVLEVLFEMQPGLLESRDYNYWTPLQVATHARRLDAVSLIMQRAARLSSGHQQHGRQQQHQQQQGFYNQQQQAFYYQQMALHQQGAYHQQLQQHQQHQGMHNMQHMQQQAMIGVQQAVYGQQDSGGGYEGGSNQQSGMYPSSSQGGVYSNSPHVSRHQHAQQNAAQKQQHSDVCAFPQGQSSPSEHESPQLGPHRPPSSPPPPPSNQQQKSARTFGSLPRPASSAAADAAATDASSIPAASEGRQRGNSARNAPNAGQQQQPSQTELRQTRQPRQPQGTSKAATASTLSAAGFSSDSQGKEDPATQSSAAEQKASGGSGKASRPAASVTNSRSTDQLQALPAAAGTDANGAPVPNFYKDAARVVGRADRQNGWRRTEPLPPSPPPPAPPTGEAGGEDGCAGGGEEVTAMRSELQAPKTPPLPTGPPPPTGFTFGRASRLQPPPGKVTLPAAPGSSPAAAAAVVSTASTDSALPAASEPQPAYSSC